MRIHLIAALTLVAVSAAPAQYQHRQGRDPRLHSEYIATGLYLISGQGSNSLLRLTGNGLILVDGKLPGNYDALMKEVASISDQPVRAMIATNHYPDHTGNNDRFIKAGTQVIAQKNVAANLASHQTASTSIAPPNYTYDKELTLQLGGAVVKLMHLGKARTDGDTVVYFPDKRVVAVGDLFTMDPKADSEAGGNMKDWARVLKEVLALDFDVAVPSRGPAVTRAQVQDLQSRMQTGSLHELRAEIR